MVQITAQGGPSSVDLLGLATGFFLIDLLSHPAAPTQFRHTATATECRTRFTASYRVSSYAHILRPAPVVLPGAARWAGASRVHPLQQN
jgi:hypothetical protein